MSVSPIPSRRANNLTTRSRSPSPIAHPTEHNTAHNAQPASTHTKNNLPSSDNTALLRSRRSSDSSLKDDSIVTEDIPLIDAEKFNPPLANPETDDPDDRPTVDAPYPGVDDGFFFNRANEDGPTFPDTETKAEGPPGSTDDLGGRRTFPSRGPTPKFPMSPTDFNGRPQFPEIELGGMPDLESIPDINVYQHKKTVAQGMMDLALFSANANQLRYVLESSMHPYYYPGIVLISFSLILQVAIGVGLIWNATYNVKDEKEICIANKINNFTIIGIFLVTVVNVFICAFGVASVQPVAASTSANP